MSAGPDRGGLRRGSGRAWSLASWLLVAAYAVLTLALYDDFGVTWDEPNHAVIGDVLLAWYGSGFTDERALVRGAGHSGGLFDAVVQIATRVSPLDPFDTRHLVTGLCGVATALGVLSIATRLAGPRAGFLAVLALMTTPVFFGHAFNNPKDVPFAAFFVGAVAQLLAAVETFPRVPWPRLLALGVLVGAAIATRIAGAPLIVLCVLAGTLWAFSRARSQAGGSTAEPLALGIRRLAVSLLVVIGVAYGVMLLASPAAQVSPLRYPIQGLGVAARFPWSLPVLFEGHLLRPTDLPRYYYLKWAALTLPEFYPLALAAGAVLGARALGAAGRGALGRMPYLQYALVATAAIGPYVLAAVAAGVMYDGLRHLLFTISLLACLVGSALDRLMAYEPRRPPVVAVVAAAAISWAVTVADMVALHPYESVFFNRAIAGGLPQAAGRYETDYWGNSYREGTEWIVRHYRGPEPVRVGSCSSPRTVEHYLPRGRFEYVGSYLYQEIDDRPDIFISTTRWGCDQRFKGRVVHIVERQGVPLLVVKERDHATAPAPTDAVRPASGRETAPVP